MNELGVKTFTSNEERRTQEYLVSLLRNCPIPDNELLDNLGLFVTSKLFARMLFLYHIYILQLEIHGIIMDFGTRWGQNMSLFSIFRSIYEPFNRVRKIVGFDTFEGFPSVSDKNGAEAQKGRYNVSTKYEEYLIQILSSQENLNPMSHVKRYEIIKGDINQTLRSYLSEHPETLVSLVYFDMDLYEATKNCLNLLSPYLIKGAVIGFDELCEGSFPGETIAFREMGWHYKLSRLPIASRASYIIME